MLSIAVAVLWLPSWCLAESQERYFTSAFPGGTTPALAKHLRSVTGGNIVLLADALHPTPKFAIQTRKMESWQRQIKAKTGFAATTSAGWRAARWPSHILNSDNQPRTSTGFKVLSEPSRILTGGKVTWLMDDLQVVMAKDLPSWLPNVNLDVHWFYASMPLAIQVKDLSLKEFLKGCADALGARLREVNSPKEGQEIFVIDFDPSEYRTRALLTFRQDRWSTNYYIQASTSLSMDILRVISDKTLTKGFAVKDIGGASEPLPARHRLLDSVARLADVHLEYIKALKRGEMDEAVVSHEIETHDFMFGRLDFDKPVTIGFNNRNSQFSIMFAVKNAPGRIALP